MMKKVIAVLLLSIVCSSTCSLAADKNEETQTPPKGVAPNWPWHRVSKQQPGRAYPTGPWNQPWAKGFPPMPSPVPVVPSPSPIAKCFKEFHIERGCYQQILTSFFTHKLNLAPECCKVVSAISDDCVGTIFARFNNPFFAHLLKKHCSSQGH
ncbi:uncharacterized protein LOC107260741 [Ricinus communis]|uniref:uncharacterized protein LOC107260741 n=1 Tax=Ricinus communis TaxID=3988 RepID=UPI0007723248|nr:uncharacterized protein LOC107260741 [Ricinus communis]|eukprot:XP_015581143.1 uncharacterized protein LOC107260741 [Ricinus communis]